MRSFVMGCCCAVRRELLDICLPIAAGYKGHDNWLVFFAEGLDAKLVEDKALQYYRRHEANESQFIANRTSKVTKYDVFFHRVRLLLSPQRIEVLSSISQEDLFAEGVKNAIEIAPKRYEHKLRALYDETREFSKLQKRRAEVRSKNVLKRIAGVAGLYRNRSHSARYGIKSAVRDLVG
jgi:hypothetical protein